VELGDTTPTNSAFSAVYDFAEPIFAIYTSNNNFSGSTTCTPPDNNIICALENAAHSMTKSMRETVAPANSGATVAKGTTMVSVAFVGIHFASITLPAVIWLMA
jgi:hypothetical protein